MSEKDIQELLSAYLDGELSPEEKGAVESRLEESLEVREDFAALTEVSQQIRMLPRPCAPANFRTGILERLDRPKVSLSSGPGRTSPPWMSYAARWSGAVAAGLLVMIGVWALTPPGRDAQLANVEKAASAPAADRVLMTNAAQDSSAGSAPSEPDARLAMAASEPPVHVVNVSPEEIRRKIEELQRPPARGNVIQVPSRMMSGEEEIPIVVVFTVVDVMEAMNQMQVLVQREQVRSRRTREPILMNQQADPQLTAVTLELSTDGPEMAAILNGVPAVDAVMFVDNQSAIPAAEPASPDPLSPEAASMGLAASERPILQYAPAPVTIHSDGSNVTSVPSGAPTPGPLADQPAPVAASAEFARNQTRGFVPPEPNASPMQQRFNFQTLAMPVESRAEAEGDQRNVAPSRSMTMMQKTEGREVSASPNRSQAPGALAESTSDPMATESAQSRKNVARQESPPGGDQQSADWNDSRRFRAYILLKQQTPPATQAPQK